MEATKVSSLDLFIFPVSLLYIATHVVEQPHIFSLSPSIEKFWPCYYYRVEKKENKSHRCFISPVSDVIFWGKKSFGAISRESDVSR
jgi:hypothetical protein